MNIYILNSIGKNKFGGGEKWVLKAAEGLSEAGHTVHVGCRTGSEIAKRLAGLGINVSGADISSDLSPYYVIKIMRYLRKHKIDALISKNRDFGVAGLAAKIAGTPAVFVRHGLPLRHWIWKHRILINRFADGIITNAKSTKEYYIKRGWFDAGMIHVVYNAVDTEGMDADVSLANEYPDKKIILSAGRLSRQKGYEYLIEAAKLLKQRRSDFVILILGRGRLLEELIDYSRSCGVGDCVSFLGFAEDVRQYLSACDMFVLPSLYEGLSNAVLEAMAAKKPVVVSDVNGSRELVEDGVNGYIVPPGNPEKLCDAIDDLLSDKEKRSLWGQRGYEYVAENFSKEKMVRDIEILLERKIAGLK